MKYNGKELDDPMAEKYKHLFKFDMPTCEADAQELCYIARLVDEAIDELVNENKELEAENAQLKSMKWISVDDVKPQWGKKVKVKFKDGSEDEVRFSHDYKWVSKGMGTCESSEVTHWMPLTTTEVK